MCTAVSYKARHHYFGRNLDYEKGFGEQIIIVPRHFSIPLKHSSTLHEHNAIIATGIFESSFPLLFDGVNEKGLCAAALNFTKSCEYKPYEKDKNNIASFEFIPYILACFDTVASARDEISRMNITDDAFSENYPPSKLHFIISDKHESIVVEQTKDGLQVYQNLIGILTNEPDFEKMMFYLSNFAHLSTKPFTTDFSIASGTHEYSRGLSGIGLPGDFSSASRFVRAAFVKHGITNAKNMESEAISVSDFFHILESVSQYSGCVETSTGEFEYTRYKCCYNSDKGIYYFKTYNSLSVCSVSMHNENLDGDTPVIYPLTECIEFKKLN